MYISTYVVYLFLLVYFLMYSSFSICTLYCSVQCTVYSVQCTVYSLQCTVYSLQCSYYSNSLQQAISVTPSHLRSVQSRPERRPDVDGFVI